MALSFTSEKTERGVTERDFSVPSGEALVPGVLWSPEGATGSRPTVLIGHGGTQNKRAANVVSLGRRLVRHLGYAALAIDAPEHGDRVTNKEAAVDAAKALQARIASGQREGRPAGMDPDALRRMGRITGQGVADWKAVLDALAAVDGVGSGPYAWWGVSMGTVIGLPFVAQEPRISCAVFGLAGAAGASGERFLEPARTLTIPVLFLYQWDDELMTRESGLALFDAIGSKEKTMHINPGGHVAMPMHERDAVEAFYKRHMGSAL